MALSIEQENKITHALRDTGMLANLTKLQDKLTQRFDLNDFGAIHQHYHDDSTNFNLDEIIGIDNPLDVTRKEMVKDGSNRVDINLFLMQSLALELPKLYNFLKAGCFIDIEDEDKGRDFYIITRRDEETHSKVIRIFYKPLDYFKWAVSECEKQFAPISGMDEEINQFIAGMEQELEYITAHEEL